MKVASWYSKALKRVKELGATIDKSNDVDPDNRSIIIDAPEGFQFTGSGTSILVVNWFPAWPESKEESFKDAFERMESGIEPNENED